MIRIGHLKFRWPKNACHELLYMYVSNILSNFEKSLLCPTRRSVPSTHTKFIQLWKWIRCVTYHKKSLHTWLEHMCHIQQEVWKLLSEEEHSTVIWLVHLDSTRIWLVHLFDCFSTFTHYLDKKTVRTYHILKSLFIIYNVIWFAFYNIFNDNHASFQLSIERDIQTQMFLILILNQLAVPLLPTLRFQF